VVCAAGHSMPSESSLATLRTATPPQRLAAERLRKVGVTAPPANAIYFLVILPKTLPERVVGCVVW
jgi:hypothetical protein